MPETTGDHTLSPAAGGCSRQSVKKSAVAGCTQAQPRRAEGKRLGEKIDLTRRWHRCAGRAALRIAKWPLPFAPALAGHDLGTDTLTVQLAHPPKPRRRPCPCRIRACQHQRRPTCHTHRTYIHGKHFSRAPKRSRPRQSKWPRQCAPCDRPRAANAHQSRPQTAWTLRVPAPHAKSVRFAWQTAPAHRQSG